MTVSGLNESFLIRLFFLFSCNGKIIQNGTLLPVQYWWVQVCATEPSLNYHSFNGFLCLGPKRPHLNSFMEGDALKYKLRVTGCHVFSLHWRSYSEEIKMMWRKNERCKMQSSRGSHIPWFRSSLRLNSPKFHLL